MNLTVNARDAMPNGGKLVIDTASATLGEVEATRVSARAGSRVRAGSYVTVAVSDTGVGMDAETKRRLFEPLFTTKEEGRGTGLGLSTCYGIVKQSGGWIEVASEPGKGALFRIWLPSVAGAADMVTGQSLPVAARGLETVLLIEDDDGVRAAATRVLEDAGYTLLVARNGIEARALVEHHDGFIHLVLSDMIMPGMNGPEVAGQIQAQRPRTKILFMSGHTDHAVVRGEIKSVHFLQKPFAPHALARKVREVLDT